MSCATFGLAGVPVRVEADLANGLPQFNVVGLTDRAIQEARERVRAAIRNTGYPFPSQRITVNLAPAEVPKEGTGFDLAIALSILVATGRKLGLGGTAFLAELALAGGRPQRAHDRPARVGQDDAGARLHLAAPGHRSGGGARGRRHLLAARRTSRAAGGVGPSALPQSPPQRLAGRTGRRGHRHGPAG